MGYRGEDVPDTHGDWGRQTPWQPSSGATPGGTGAWDNGSRGYEGDENYPPVGGGYGYGYGPDGGYPGQDQHGQQDQQDQQGYGPQDGQYGNSYGQQPHEQYNGYGTEPGHGGAVGNGGSQGYPQQDGYDRGQNPAPGYDQAGYDQRAAPGYAPGGGYQDPSGDYGQAPAYPSAPPPGYPQYPPALSSGYPSALSSGYPSALSSGYPSAPSGGGYPAPRGGTGGYLALPSGQGSHSAEDSGNDWYGGQPAASNGASFADTGTYRLNGRVTDEYGTGMRGALHDPVHGFPPGPAEQGNGQPPGPLNPATSGPQGFSRTGQQALAETRQQERYVERSAYPEYGQAEPGGRHGPVTGDARDGYSAPGAYAAPGHGGYDGASSPSADPSLDGYHDYEEAFDDFEAGDDPYQDHYGDGNGFDATRAAGRGPDRPPGRGALGPLRGKRLLFAALGVVAVGIIGVAAYVFVLNPTPAGNTNTEGPLPTSGTQPSEQACVQQLGTYCHIEAATDDPVPLKSAELYPPAFTNEKDKTSYSLVSTKVDTKCANAVIGTTLIKTLQTGKCTQVVRASYVSGNNKIMGTIGVINLTSTNEAHYAGKVVGQNDFIAPLTSAKGVASKLGNGTGVVEAEFKGHYLILTWSEFVAGTNPSTKAQDNQLEQFSNDLVAGTANIDLSQRMVTGAAPTPSASS